MARLAATSGAHASCEDRRSLLLSCCCSAPPLGDFYENMCHRSDPPLGHAAPFSGVRGIRKILGFKRTHLLGPLLATEVVVDDSPAGVRRVYKKEVVR